MFTLKKSQADKATQEEIERLRREVDYLRNQPPRNNIVVHQPVQLQPQLQPEQKLQPPSQQVPIQTMPAISNATATPVNFQPKVQAKSQQNNRAPLISQQPELDILARLRDSLRKSKVKNY
jgi:hypothetical protein